MPLRDHFHRPARRLGPWQSFHATWATWITHILNQKPLPPGYRALPQVKFSTTAQVDVATVEDDEEEREAAGDGAVVVPADLANLDVIEIEVHNDEEGYRLVAAVELVSPANKDRSSHRQAFVAKCVGYLQQDVSVVVVDVVTERRDNLHAELMDLLELGEGPKAAAPSDLYAVAYRAVGREVQPARLEMWPASLRLGESLPTLPLWIAPAQAVPLDLEASYAAACASLRMR